MHAEVAKVSIFRVLLPLKGLVDQEIKAVCLSITLHNRQKLRAEPPSSRLDGSEGQVYRKDGRAKVTAR